MGFAHQLQKLSTQPVEEQELISKGWADMKDFAQSLKLTSNNQKPEVQTKSQAKGREIGM